MAKPIIDTPRGTIMVMPNGKASLTFKTNFQSKHQKKFTAAQVFVDSEVLRLCEPLTPLLTSMLIKSGTLGTVPGEGVVSWIAPYSHKRYYTPRKTPSKTGAQRGPYWFDRMKAAHEKYLRAGAKKIAAGES